MCNLIVSVPDHCLSFYLRSRLRLDVLALKKALSLRSSVVMFA